MRLGLEIAGGLLGWGLFIAGFLALGGRWDWWQGWFYSGLLTLTCIAFALMLWRRDPELFRRRGRIGAGTPTWDLVCLGCFGLALLGALPPAPRGFQGMTPASEAAGGEEKGSRPKPGQQVGPPWMVKPCTRSSKGTTSTR